MTVSESAPLEVESTPSPPQTCAFARYIIGQPEDSPAPIVASSLGQFYVRALAEAGAEELLPVARPHSLNQEGYATI
jgi:hypothetical protein